MLNRFLISALLAVFAFSASAQYDGEFWGGVVVTKKINKKWNVGGAGQVRLNRFASNLKSSFFEVNTAYRYNKHVKVKFNYRFARRPGFIGGTANRHRGNIDLTLRDRKKKSPFTYSLRFRLQQEYENLWRPENHWLATRYIRFRPMVDYSINKKYGVGTGIEAYHSLNNRYGNRFDNVRFIVALDRDLKKKTLFYRNTHFHSVSSLVVCRQRTTWRWT